MAVIALPIYNNFRKKAITVEAKSSLTALYKMETSYFGENNSYTTDVEGMGFNLNPKKEAYYKYTMLVGENSFTATAEGNLDNDADLDIWTIDDLAHLTHVNTD